MRVSIFAAAAALSLAACGNDNQSENRTAADEGLTAESIVANDVTAIDAVTADAANMAADVDINFTEEFPPQGGNATGARPPIKSGPAKGGGASPRRSSPPPPETTEDTPAVEPAANTAE